MLNTFETNRTFNHPGLSTSTITANFAFLGAHFYTKSSLKFKNASVRYFSIDEWLNVIHGFKSINTDLENYKINIEYELPKAIDISVNSNLKISLNITAKGTNRGMVQKEVNIKQQAFINFVYKRKVKFDNLFDDASHFQKFLTLCFQKSTHPLIFYINIKDCTNHFHKVEVFYQHNSERKAINEIIPMDMLVPFRSYPSKIITAINEWFKKKDSFKNIIDPFFRVYHNDSSYLSDEFLHLARALEAFHRDLINRSGKNRVRYTTVLRKYSPIYNRLLKIRSKPKYVNKILDYRNKLTHSNLIELKLEKKFLELFKINERLKIIISVEILSELGFDKQEIIKLLFDTRLYSHIRYRL